MLILGRMILVIIIVSFFFAFMFFSISFVVDFDGEVKKGEEDRLKNVKIDIERKKLKKYSKKNETLLVSVLRYEYFEYVKIVEEILDEICDRTKVETNDLYLTKLNQNFKKIDADIYDISGMACFYDAIIEYPVINEINDETRKISKEFIKKIVEYTFFNEYYFCEEKKISVYDKRKELYKYVRELIT